MIATVITDERTIAFGIAGLCAWGATFVFLAGYALHWGIEYYKGHRFAKRLSANFAEIDAARIEREVFNADVRRMPAQLRVVRDPEDEIARAFDWSRPDGAA